MWQSNVKFASKITHISWQVVTWIYLQAYKIKWITYIESLLKHDKVTNFCQENKNNDVF